jgi:hypothetical protein
VQFDRSEGLALAGAVLAAAGTPLPWVVVAPGQRVVPAVFLDGMGWRVGGFDVVVLGVLAVGLVAAAAHCGRRRGGHLLVATGVLVALLAVYGPLASVGGFLGTFLPGPGAGVTLLGGLLLVAAGRRQARAVDGARDAADAPAG